MPTMKNLLLPLICLIHTVATAAPGDPVKPPRYDATGDWILHISGPRLLSGACPVTDDEGYDENVQVRQDHGVFVITTADGLSEQGSVSGAVYTHGSTQQGTDMTGIDFTLVSRSTFTLTSSDEAAGETLLELYFGDGTRCLLHLRFEGERRHARNRQSGPGHTGPDRFPQALRFQGSGGTPVGRIFQQ